MRSNRMNYYWIHLWYRVAKLTFINYKNTYIITLNKGATNLDLSLPSDCSCFHEHGAECWNAKEDESHNCMKKSNTSLFDTLSFHTLLCKIWKYNKILMACCLISAWKCCSLSGPTDLYSEIVKESQGRCESHQQGGQLHLRQQMRASKWHLQQQNLKPENFFWLGGHSDLPIAVAMPLTWVSPVT